MPNRQSLIPSRSRAATIIVDVSKDAIAVGVAGVFFGLLVGWIIGSQQATGVAPQPAAAQAQAAGGSPASGSQQQAPQPIDESRVAAMKADAERNPNDPAIRVQLGNMYFDAERLQEAAQWYEAALKINPKDVNASTDLGIAYYYMNQPDRALAQFDHSLAVDPGHAKTLLNQGIVRAFGKQDLKGAAAAWEKVLQVAPNSDEARAAKQALDGVRAAHQNLDAGSGTGR
jgi:cytochrome c-type biogenesis protein CcmH/NrfG